MASSKENRAKFINSLMDLLETFDLDGVDLDWEYPVAGVYCP
jgi:chitinase